MLGLRIQVPAVSSRVVCALMLMGYFAVSSGVIYDWVTNTPSVGTASDPSTGLPITIPFLKNRVNAQYSIEGFSAGFLFLLGGLGLLLLDWANQRHLSARHRTLYLLSGVVSTCLAYNLTGLFMRLKVPGYLR